MITILFIVLSAMNHDCDFFKVQSSRFLYSTSNDSVYRIVAKRPKLLEYFPAHASGKHFRADVTGRMEYDYISVALFSIYPDI